MSEQFKPNIVAFLCNWCTYAGADLAGTSPVSYTHLDVYKRQLYIPVVESKAEIIEGEPDEKAEKLASILVKGGLV